MPQGHHPAIEIFPTRISITIEISPSEVSIAPGSSVVGGPSWLLPGSGTNPDGPQRPHGQRESRSMDGVGVAGEHRDES